MTPSLRQVKRGLHAEPLIGIRPAGLSRRIAISGEIPAWPLMTRDSVCRATPNTFAPLVTVRPKGSRQASLIEKPGWGGFFIGMVGADRAVTDAEVMKVHRSALLIDTHNDVTSATVDGLDIGLARKEGHSDIPRMKAGGLGAQFFAVFVGGNYTDGNKSAHRALEMIDTVRHDIIGKYPREFQYATTVDEILKARKAGKIAALMGIEGGHAIEDSPRLLRDFYLMGVRYMTLTHSNSNTWAGSSGDADGKTKGLTDLGKTIVREMNRLGMMVDIFARVGQDVLGRARNEHGADFRVAFLVEGAVEDPAQHDRRNDRRAGEERRRGTDQLRLRVHFPAVGRHVADERSGAAGEIRGTA